MRLFTDTNYQGQIVKAIEKANFRGDKGDWVLLGYYVGNIGSAVLDY